MLHPGLHYVQRLDKSAAPQQCGAVCLYQQTQAGFLLVCELLVTATDNLPSCGAG